MKESGSMWCTSFKRVTWLIHVCDMTHSYVYVCQGEAWRSVVRFEALASPCLRTLLRLIVFQGSVLQCVTVRCNVLQCVAVFLATLYLKPWQAHVFELSYVYFSAKAVCCRVLQGIAVCFIMLQCVAVCCSVLSPGQAHVFELSVVQLPSKAVCCSVLQRVAACVLTLRACRN